VSGASEWLESSAVTYTESAKQRMIGVSAEALREHGAVSEVVARQMAEGARAAAKVEWGASVTGFAAPPAAPREPGRNRLPRRPRPTWTSWSDIFSPSIVNACDVRRHGQ